ncbi:MAG: cytochrome P450 [Cytophagales bacterium]|nr:cytochrome P450 [Cytophagales bacterium]
MSLPKAFPDQGIFKNLKIFQLDPIGYMEKAIRKGGSPVDLHLPMGDFVLLNDPNQFSEVFLNERENYQKSRGYKEIAHVLGNGLLTAEGEEWHLQRKMLQPSFHKTELRKLIPAIWHTGEHYLESIKNGQSLRLDTEMSGLTLTVLMNSLIHYQHEELIQKMGQHIVFSQEFIVNRIRTPFKWPLWIPTRDNKGYHQMMRETNELIQQCVDSRKADPNKIEDILTVLMEQYDPEREFVQIRNQLLTLLIAGHETSAIALTWTMHLLGHHPEIQRKVFEEVKKIQALADIDLMNYTGLEYTHKVIKESLRYYPPIWNVVRRAIKPHRVGGFEIQKGKQLMLNVYLLHRNEQYWERPEVFDPERFTHEKMREFHKFQYLPFGGGGRFCIGNNFAMYEILLLLTQFVRSFEIKSLSPEKVPFNPLLTLRPKETIEVKLIKR